MRSIRPITGEDMKKRALIVGVANERSLAWAIAQSLHKQGVELAFTYVNEKMEDRVRPLAQSLGCTLVFPCDVSSDEQIEKLFSDLGQKWDSLDTLVHSVAFADRKDLEGRFMDTSRTGFAMALDISAYSLVALAKHSEKLMKNGGSMITLSYLGAQRVVPNYNVMGVAKAALEACVRYLAYDLGPQKIRVNAISAGPVKTLAAAGIRNFRDMLKSAEEKTPMKENITPESVGELGAFLCSDGGRHITGEVIYVDSGYHITS
jgi:enoyl-[acyl-carrier protein] reductase I